MTSTTTGLPDRYRPLDQVAPDEQTPTGVIRSWRARDRVLNRDVLLRVHTPGGPAAREWIARALTAGGLATPALAMVYDAAEGTGGSGPGGAAYVVNEWIEGTRLSDRLADGPLSERDARGVVRRLAEGVAEAHRVGLAVGGLTPEHVVLRSGGLVGLLSVPAATGTVQGDIAALGALLELCLTGAGSDLPGSPPPAIGSPDLAALVRRARSDDPATGLSSANTLVRLLADRPRTNPQELVEEPVQLRRQGLPPVPGSPAAAAGPESAEDDDLDLGGTFSTDPAYAAADTAAPTTARRRLAVVGLPLLALALVVAIGWWFGSSVLSVAGNVDEIKGSTPSVSAPAAGAPAAGSSSPAPSAPVPGATLPIAGAAIYNPFGDGEPENDNDIPATVDGNPATGWSTVTYRGSAAFGNLKPGVGVLLDLGADQPLAGVTVQTSTPGATVEIRTGGGPTAGLDAFTVSASGPLTGRDDLAFTTPVTTRYVLVWLTGLVPADGGFSADITEVSVTAAG